VVVSARKFKVAFAWPKTMRMVHVPGEPFVVVKVPLSASERE
jgi:hypothetical protein